MPEVEQEFINQVVDNSINRIEALCELLDEEKEKLREIIKED